jgi:hypothetical protein
MKGKHPHRPARSLGFSSGNTFFGGAPRRRDGIRLIQSVYPGRRQDGIQRNFTIFRCLRLVEYKGRRRYIQTEAVCLCRIIQTV